MSQPIELPRWMDVAVLPAVNLAIALLVAGGVVLLVGFKPDQVLALLLKGAFGSKAGISYTLYYATTFVFTGLAVAVAFHGGLFNIGGEGQAVMGGLGAGLAALAWSAHLHILTRSQHPEERAFYLRTATEQRWSVLYQTVAQHYETWLDGVFEAVAGEEGARERVMFHPATGIDPEAAAQALPATPRT